MKLRVERDSKRKFKRASIEINDLNELVTLVTALDMATQNRVGRGEKDELYRRLTKAYRDLVRESD